MDGEVTVRVTAPGAARIVVIPGPPVQAIKVAGGPPGQEGPPGPEGPAGPGAGFVGTAGANLSGGIAAVEISGLIYPADPTDITHASRVVGITTGAASSGNPVNIAQAGELDGESYASANAAMYIGLNGILSPTQEAPGAVWFMRVGTTKTTTSLIIVLQPPIQLS